MPIKPENMKRYPGGPIYSAQWKTIRTAVLTAARGHCEGSSAYPDCHPIHGGINPATGSRVVLPVELPDHDPSNNSSANLRTWCQCCNSTHDASPRSASGWGMGGTAFKLGAPILWTARPTRRSRRAGMYTTARIPLNDAY